MNKIFEWIWQNKEWVFSGVGIAVLSGLGTIMALFFRLRRSKNRELPFQQQEAGNNSQNVQVGEIGKAGRDINISVNQPSSSEESPS